VRVKTGRFLQPASETIANARNQSGFGRAASKQERNDREMNHVRKSKLMYPEQWTKKYGVWDEKTKTYILPSGTVKQGRRPMFKPFNDKEEGK
jgi:hypothetical protein